MLRDRGRTGNRPRPWSLRALHQHAHLTGQQRHIRPHFPERHRQGAPWRLSWQDSADHTAYHRRDQARHQDPWRNRPIRLRHHRDRRHRGRHRVAPVSGKRQTAPLGAWTRQRDGAPHLRALPPRGQRTQDKTHPTLCQAAAAARHTARHTCAPNRKGRPGTDESQDSTILQRSFRRRDPVDGLPLDLRRAADATFAAPRRDRDAPYRTDRKGRTRPDTMAQLPRPSAQRLARSQNRPRGQIRGTSGCLQINIRSTRTRRHLQRPETQPDIHPLRTTRRQQRRTASVGNGRSDHSPRIRTARHRRQILSAQMAS